MRCIKCGAKKKGDPEHFDFRCPSCGHRVAASKRQHGLTDQRINKALDVVSAKGECFFLTDHLGYEMLRGKKSRGIKGLIAFLVLLGLVAVFAPWPVGAGCVALGTVVCFVKLRARPPPDWFTLAHKFLSINPSDRLLADDAAGHTLPEPGSAEHELAQTADRVVVCQHRSVANFLLANQAHLHHACPVVGPDGYPPAFFPGIVERVKRRDAPTVFVLHDLTPRGERFVDEVRRGDEWFGDRRDIVLVDLGLTEGQKPSLGTVSRPLKDIYDRPDASSSKPVGAEITALRPRALLTALGVALAACAPLALPAAGAAAAGGASFDSE